MRTVDLTYESIYGAFEIEVRKNATEIIEGISQLQRMVLEDKSSPEERGNEMTGLQVIIEKRKHEQYTAGINDALKIIAELCNEKYSPIVSPFDGMLDRNIQEFQKKLEGGFC